MPNGQIRNLELCRALSWAGSSLYNPVYPGFISLPFRGFLLVEREFPRLRELVLEDRNNPCKNSAIPSRDI